jgi:hypothetical protein
MPDLFSCELSGSEVLAFWAAVRKRFNGRFCRKR